MSEDENPIPETEQIAPGLAMAFSPPEGSEEALLGEGGQIHLLP